MRKKITSEDIMKGLDYVDTKFVEGRATYIEIDPEVPSQMRVYGNFVDEDGQKYDSLNVELGEYHIDEPDVYASRYPTPEELEEYTAGELLRAPWRHYTI